MRCGNSSKHIKMPGKLRRTKMFVKFLKKWEKRHLEFMIWLEECIDREKI